ncbi:heterokaryon incompatibility protein-domain-containing protein [Stachybotrys elegans]|uniref:Heterokaryon incompatibility protein-domain-containing protein n=1 Tax=Stachybotrys elegans TaxID=80388 RepID=A0A8K0SHY8_9HYPO|nr:heterokaryon incompatibility protein-domain-containing protein [Stachybotrys elegans]
MPTILTFDTDAADVPQDTNDWIHLQERGNSDSDNSDSEYEDELFAKYSRFRPLNKLIRRSYQVASEYKDRFKSALTRAGLCKARIYRDGVTGNCLACRGMDVLFTAFRELEIAAKAGCPSCGILAEAVRRYFPEAISSPNLTPSAEWNSGCAGRQFVRTNIKSSEQPGALGVLVLLQSGLGLSDIFTGFRKGTAARILGELNFFGVQGDATPWNTVGLARNISGNTSSAKALRWAQDCLQKCVDGHTLCKTLDNSKLPPLVLDLGCANQDGNPDCPADIRLYKSEDTRARYVCLSYCWGGPVEIRLTKERYRSYTNNISWSMLPKGYQDAIELTRKLGIRYIWIDSLCIIQDDNADWEIQASLMTEIFQNAYLTIAGTKSRNPNDGYFSVSPAKYKSSRIEHEDKEGTLRHAYVRCTIPHFFSTKAARGTDYSPGDFPLLQRGWVFQERLLSPRLLHLGDVEMAWECNETCACECIGETRTYDSEPRWVHTKGKHARNLAKATSWKDLQPEWRSIVEHYTRTNLTFDKDIFPAISGVVKDMQRFRSDQYLAGIWESSALEDLAWLTVNSNRPRPEAWRAPSWSWASVKSPIVYRNYRTVLSSEYIEDTDPQAQHTVLLKASVTPKGKDPTGEIQAGHLVLFGPVLSAQLLGDIDGLYVAKCFLADRVRLHTLFKADYDLAAPGPGHVPVGSQIYLLHLCQEPRFKNKERRDMQRKQFALVLRRVDNDTTDDQAQRGREEESDEVDGLRDTSNGTYERIGLHIITPDESDEAEYIAEHGVACVVKLI